MRDKYFLLAAEKWALHIWNFVKVCSLFINSRKWKSYLFWTIPKKRMIGSISRRRWMDVVSRDDLDCWYVTGPFGTTLGSGLSQKESRKGMEGTVFKVKHTHCLRRPWLSPSFFVYTAFQELFKVQIKSNTPPFSRDEGCTKFQTKWNFWQRWGFSWLASFSVARSIDHYGAHRRTTHNLGVYSEANV